MTRILQLTLILLCGCGCTVVSQNRVFPKLDWYWSKDAKMQRETLKHESSLNTIVSTNEVVSIMPPMPAEQPVTIVPIVEQQTVIIKQPTIIPLNYPSNMLDYVWDIYGSPSITGPWQHLYGPCQGIPEGTIDVSSYGNQGFYKLVGTKQ